MSRPTFEEICTTLETDRGLSCKERLQFHYFNPNGAYALKQAANAAIDEAVAKGYMKSGAILAYGALATYHENALIKAVTAKRFERIKTQVIIEGLIRAAHKAFAQAREAEAAATGIDPAPRPSPEPVSAPVAPVPAPAQVNPPKPNVLAHAPARSATRRSTWCGPYGIAVVAGKQYDEVYPVCQKVCGRPNVSGMSVVQVRRALENLHVSIGEVITHIFATRTLAQWAREVAKPGMTYFVNVTGHFVIFRDGMIIDNQIAEWRPVEGAKHYTRARVRVTMEVGGGL